MLVDFILRCLVMLLGYAYPAFECYKTVEKTNVEIDELRFWCQYWVLVAMLAVIERIGDIFISWIPLYGELKLGLYIYLWYPKTKGSEYVYQTLFRPVIAKHETDIDRKILELKARARDIFIYYFQNCTHMGQTTLLQFFQYMIAQTAKLTNPTKTQKVDEQNLNEKLPLEEASSGVAFLKCEKQTSQTKKFLPPTTVPVTPKSIIISHSMSETVSDSIQVMRCCQGEAVLAEDTSIPEQDNTIPSSM